MIIDKKLLQALHILKVKTDIDEFPLPSLYLYIFEKECIFINKSRSKYNICCTPNVIFEKFDSQSVLDILYSTEDRNEAIRMFRSYVKEML